MRRISLGIHQIDCQTIEETHDVLPLIAKHITEVYPASPASKLGLQAGDFLVGINKKPAAQVDVQTIVAQGTETTYLIHRPEASLTFAITSSGLPLGIRDEYTSKSILKRASDLDADYGELYNLWERAEWPELLKAARSLRMDDSWFLKTLRKIFRRTEESPALLMHGIALWELGKHEQAIALIQKYEDEHINWWTTEWHALTYYYQGLAQLSKADNDAAEGYFYASEQYCRCPILQSKLRELGVDASVNSPWYGQRFPVDFKLQDFAQSRYHNLSEILADATDKLVFVCVMPSYRANAPYDDIVQIYDRIIQLLPDLVSPLYVVSDVKELEETSRHRYWMQNEQRMIAEGKPIVLLYDEDRAVADVLEQATTPNLYLLNSDGIVLSASIEFEFDTLWSLINQEFGDLFEQPVSS